MTEAKIHPPSPSRIAEARAAGIAPQPLLAGLAGAVGALWIFEHSFAAGVWSQLGALWRAPLAALAAGDFVAAERVAHALVLSLGVQLAKLGLLVFGCVSLSLLLAQGPQFAWPWRARRRFAQPKPSLAAALLLCVALLGLLAFRIVAVFWLEPSGIAALLSRSFGALALVVCALALIDTSFARARFFQALWLTRREQRRDQREAYGAPEVRAARAHARQEQAGRAPPAPGARA